MGRKGQWLRGPGRWWDDGRDRPPRKIDSSNVKDAQQAEDWINYACKILEGFARAFNPDEQQPPSTGDVEAVAGPLSTIIAVTPVGGQERELAGAGDTPGCRIVAILGRY